MVKNHNKITYQEATGHIVSVPHCVMQCCRNLTLVSNIQHVALAIISLCTQLAVSPAVFCARLGQAVLQCAAADTGWRCSAADRCMMLPGEDIMQPGLQSPGKIIPQQFALISITFSNYQVSLRLRRSKSAVQNVCPCCRSLSTSPASTPPPAATCSTAVGNTQHTTHCSPSLQYLPTHTAVPVCKIYVHKHHCQILVSSHIEEPTQSQSANSNQCVLLTGQCCKPNLLHCVENPISTHPIRQETRHIKIYEPEMFVGLVGHEFLVLFPASHFPL